MSDPIPTQFDQTPEPQRSQHARRVAAALTAPFNTGDIKFKPQMVKNNRALAIAYIDARLVEDRLDDVVGMEHWSDDYSICQDGSVVCRLSVRLDGEWITKADVGSPSEQPDGGDRLKAAFSDALKRAAVKFGIGRYLYRIPNTWCEYDAVKKQITQIPQLPAFAVPAAQRAKSEPGRGQPGQGQTQQGQKPAANGQPPTQPQQPNPSLPATGVELSRRVRDYDTKLAAQKVCAAGSLIAHVIAAGVKAGYSSNMADWAGPAIAFAVEAVKDFDFQTREKSGSRGPV